MTIKIIITGGTIDKEYDPQDQEFELKKSHIRTMLREGRFSSSIKINTLMFKDSLDMNLKDREKIIKECKQAKQKMIVITHGTDTMVETAKVLGKNINEKTIVLTGAMQPAVLEKTDALFNLGGAIIAVQTLPTGVYIAMNGKIFMWDNVKKNISKSQFEKLK